MFQTELNIWLQSFSSPALTFAMRAMSLAGTPAFFTTLALFIIYAVDYRKGIILTYFFLWTFLATTILKDGFGLPRPDDVDSTVQRLEQGIPNSTPFTGFGADSFFGTLPPEIVHHFRMLPNHDYGFPSGHCSMTVTAWGLLAFMFRRKFLTWLSLTVIVLIPLSRMYLGRHFLADVIGGILVGVAVLGLAVLTLRSHFGSTILAARASHKPGSLLSVLAVGTAIAVPFLFQPNVRLHAATILGLSVGASLVLLGGFPPEQQSLWRKILLLSLTIAVFAAGSLLFVKPLFETDTASMAEVLDTFLSTLLLTAGPPIIAHFGQKLLRRKTS